MKKSMWLVLLSVLVGVVVQAAQMTIEDRAKAQAGVLKESLQLSDDQVVKVTEALVEKLTVGKAAYKLKQGGDEEGAKAMWKESGAKFHKVLSGILTSEQMEAYKTDKEAIMEKVNAIQ